MMQTNRWKRRAAVLLSAAAMALALPALQTPAEAAPDSGLNAGGEVFLITPQRIMDSRNPALDVAPAGIKRADGNGEIYRVPVTTRADAIPESNVLAVLANVIVVNPSGGGYLAVRPGGQPASNPPTSLVNFVPGADVPNLGIVGVNGAGEIDIELVSGVGGDQMHVIVDVYGWIATSSHTDTADVGTRVVSVFPQRTLDTRAEAPILQSGIDAGKLQPFESVALPVRGIAPVPNDADVTGVVVNLTGVNAEGGTYVSLTPSRPPAGQEPTTSNGNFVPGAPRANLAIVPLSSDGKLWITNGPARLDVLVDVVGYMVTGESATTQTGRVVPLEAPFRSFDTREAEFGSVRLGAKQWEDWSFTAFSQSVTIGNDSGIAQQGFFANLVAFDLQNSGLSFFTLNPREAQPFSGPPGNSTLNLPPGREIGNMSLVRYGSDGQGDNAMISAYNDDGSAHYHLDVYAVILG